MGITITDKNGYKSIITDNILYLKFSTGMNGNLPYLKLKVSFPSEALIFKFDNILQAVKAAEKLKNSEVFDEEGYRKSLDVINEYFENKYIKVLNDEEQKYVLDCLEGADNEKEGEETVRFTDEVVDKMFSHNIKMSNVT